MVEFEAPIIETPIIEAPIIETPIIETPIIETPIYKGIFEGTKEWQLYYTRLIRNSFLELTDKYMMPDYPITPENLEIIKTYRQMLREWININKDIIMSDEKIEIPTIPKI